MAEAFGIAAGVVGVISLTLEIIKIPIQFGLDWKDAPADARSFIAELQGLKTVLSETHTNIIVNQDFADAFHGRHSALLSQLAPSSHGTDTMSMVSACKVELEELHRDLLKQAQGHRMGWERLKGAFQPTRKREAVKNLHRQCQILNQLLAVDSLTLTAGIYREVKESKKQQQQATILDWLSPVDYAPQQNDFISRRQEGTGQWLLESAEFRAWIDGEKQTLFCPGIPGAGKTILASIVVDDLCTRFQNDKSISVVYIYCNFRQQDEQKAENLLANLLKQLAQHQDDLPDSVKHLYDHHKDKRTRPSIDEISRALQSISALYSKVFIVVDALDECQGSGGCRSKFLSEIFNLQARHRVNFFTTSRHIPEIIETFKGSISQEIRATEQDVRRYIDGHISHLPSFVRKNPDLQEEIRTTIVSAVDGMFLLAQLHLDSLIGKRSPKAIRIALAKLPTGSEAYDCAYDNAMNRIEGQVRDQEDLAKQVLSWITCAKRPLTTTELRHALAVEVGESELDEENLPQTEDMVSACAGLVTVDKESGIIRLVHYTTQEYFQRRQAQWFPTAEEDITITCVTYLSFDVFKSGPSPTDDAFEERVRVHQLYEYAAHNWGHHARNAQRAPQGVRASGHEDDIFKCREPVKNVTKAIQLVMNFLGKKDNFEAGVQALFAKEPWYLDYSQAFPRATTTLHLAAYFGLEDVAKLLLAIDSDGPDMKDNDGRTPLSWAATNGHEGIVKLLLAINSVEPDTKDNDGRTPLSLAATNGHEGIVKLLLAVDSVEPDIRDNDGRTLLILAATNGHEGIVKLLLAIDSIEPDAKDNDGRTPLSLAAANGHEGIVKLLLAIDSVEPNIRDKDGRTPLSWAAANGHEGIVKLLLAIDSVEPDTKAKFYYGRTPLSWAAMNGHEGIVKLLLAIDSVEPDTKDKFYSRTPLSWAAINGHEGIVKLLLAVDSVEPDIRDISGQTPLSWAATNGHEGIVKLLLAIDSVEPDTKDRFYSRTPLGWAAMNGHEGIVKLLLAIDSVEPDMKDNNGRTPLSWAAANSYEGIVKLLLAIDSVEPDVKDNDGQTPLSLAAANGHEGIVKLFLAINSVEPDTKDNNGRTPLSRAAANGHEGILKLLLTINSVEPDTKDNDAQTPLSWAAANGHEGIVKLLLAIDSVEPDAKDNDGWTPLSLAAANGHEGIVKLLLAIDSVEPDIKDNDARTPLSWAAANGHEGIVKLLLAIDSVEPDVKDNIYGQTPLSLAAENGHEGIVKLLITASSKSSNM
ncbi:hypothetical protein jhhlp_004972 [Lomentospora prolificans]|uniref:Uncharacterized protein n=1 Tax=Lomentospora prolificans TaxID=41688 RepID=A0A2N3N811_9PEZI|nr:hypothetical protein jhhlp_004972 [Lomentospora prolificans]